MDEYGPDGFVGVKKRNDIECYKKIETGDPAQMAILLRWRQGRTGMPIVDACMREMN